MPVSSSHQIIREYYTYYSNDSLKLAYKFPADYEAITDWKTAKTYLKNKNSVFNKESFVIGFRTDNKPFLQHLVFIYPTSLTPTDTFTHKIDSSHYTFEKRYLDNHQNRYIHFYATSSKDDFDNLQHEYQQIFESVKVGTSYQKAIPQNPFDVANDYFWNKDSTANYLTPFLRLQAKASNYTQRNDKSLFIQALATYTSFISNETDSLQKLWAEWRNISYLKDISKPNLKVIDEDALQQLLSLCKNEQVVMFNEAHFDPQHRLLPTLLLDSLYAYGFRYLALESLWENEDSLNKRKFPVLKSGFYTREPSKANLIRLAIQKGFYVVGYDDFSVEREKGQAKNLFEKTLKKQPNAKVLVLAGFGHINEQISTRKNMMAREFFELTNINPFTIDQVEYMNSSNHWLAIVEPNTNQKHITTDLFLANAMWKKPLSKNYIQHLINIPQTIQQELALQRGIYKGMLYVYDTDEWLNNKYTIPLQTISLKNTTSISLSLQVNRHYTFVYIDIQGDVIATEQLALN